MQRNAQRRKPSDGGLCVEAPKYPVDDFPLSMEIRRPDFPVGDIAPPASGNQDFGPDVFRAVQKGNAKPGIGFSGKDGSRQSRGPGTDDGQVHLAR